MNKHGVTSGSGFLPKQLLLFCLFLLACVTSSYAQYDAVVAKDGTGNYNTLQAAINAAPANLTTPYKILLKKVNT